MPLNEQQSHITNNAQSSIKKPERERRADKVLEIVDQFVNRPAIGGRKQWFSWVNQDQQGALRIWENYISQNPRVVAKLAPIERWHLYTALGFTKDIVDAKVKLPPKSAYDGFRPSRQMRFVNADPKMVEDVRIKEPQEKQVHQGGGQVRQSVQQNGGQQGDGQVRQENGQQGGLQMEQNGQNGQFSGYPIANVFRDFYGGNVNEAYQWSVSDEKVDDNNTVRRVRVFRSPEDRQTHFYFEPEPDGGWSLKHISGQAIARGLIYNPKERRFYATNDVPPEQMLQALRRFQSGGTTETNGTANARGTGNVPGAVQFLDLGQNRYAWVGLDGKLHYGTRSGDGTMISERSVPLQQLFEAPSAQQATPESSMNWLMTMLPLLLLILARR